MPSLQKQHSAFTLVEILTATAIMMILIVAILRISVDAFRAYESATAMLATSAESRDVIVPLQQDIESAIIRNDGNTWIQIEHEADDYQGNLNLGSSPKLMLFTPAPDRVKYENGQAVQIPGDVCAVHYRIAHRSPHIQTADPSQCIYGFYRSIVDAQASFDTALPIALNPKNKNDGLLEFWRGSADVLDRENKRVSQDLQDWIHDLHNFRASHIVGLSFSIWYYELSDPTNPRLEVLVHSDFASDLQNNLGKAGLDIQVQNYTRSLKIANGSISIDGAAPKENIQFKNISFSVTVLSPEGAKILRGLQQSLSSPKIPQAKFDEVVLQNSHTFTGSARVGL
ncbi:MAG: prepilin-type N-terminal cleavage/methylation domain-containing protein [Puniceicoccales bacterium]|jgi:type II secretory pathway pseudopilin PulG|nr:prepilin-type N-terminal cleavage/methylation domain-containing protein [Puniceicoccales bacterium]